MEWHGATISSLLVVLQKRVLAQVKGKTVKKKKIRCQNWRDIAVQPRRVSTGFAKQLMSM